MEKSRCDKAGVIKHICCFYSIYQGVKLQKTQEETSHWPADIISALFIFIFIFIHSDSIRAGHQTAFPHTWLETLITHNRLPTAWQMCEK